MFVYSIIFLIFAVGFSGLLVYRNNLIVLLMCVEIILLSINLFFSALSHQFDDLGGQVFSFFVLSAAAAESAVGLALAVVCFRLRGVATLDSLVYLKG